MTKTVAKRLREASAQGQDIYGIHCDLELEAANEIDILQRENAALKDVQKRLLLELQSLRRPEDVR